METIKQSYDQLVLEIEELRLQLEEANETIDAIRTGQVDAFVFKGYNGHELYTLKSADQTYRIIIEKMTEGAVTLNASGIIVYSNSQFARMVGLPLSQVTGAAFNEFIVTQDKSKFQELAERGWTKDIKGEVAIIGLNQTIPVQVSLTTLHLDEGLSLSIILTDLTPQKEIQLLLKVNNEKLNSLNNALELSNDDLLQFASVASHDLQEPLRKIQIFSNILEQKFSYELSEQADSYLKKIISSSKRMNVLITDILNYSRLSQNANLFELTDLNLVIRELLEDYELLINEQGAKITIEDLPSIEVNPGQIRQVFQNIISNALKFAKKGIAPSVYISSKMISTASFDNKEQKQIAGPFCSLSFKDNGIGFDEKFATKIFTLFHRLHSRDQFEGTGIGLAISKKIVEKHNGFITASSKEGIGSEVTIILPISQHSK